MRPPPLPRSNHAATRACRPAAAHQAAQAGCPPPSHAPQVFDQALAGGGAKGINFQDLAADLAQITFDYPFRIPPYFALIIRAIGALALLRPLRLLWPLRLLRLMSPLPQGAPGGCAGATPAMVVVTGWLQLGSSWRLHDGQWVCRAVACQLGTRTAATGGRPSGGDM